MNTRDNLIKPYSPLHIIEHARKRALKGKGPTLSFTGINNPQKALHVARKLHEGGLIKIRELLAVEDTLTEERFLVSREFDEAHDVDILKIDIRYTEDTQWFISGLEFLGYGNTSTCPVSNWGSSTILFLPRITVCMSCMGCVDGFGVAAPDRTCHHCGNKTADNYCEAFIFEGQRYYIANSRCNNDKLPVPSYVSLLSFNKGFDEGSRSWRERYADKLVA